MSDEPSDYLFHVHATVPAWRLVLRKGDATPDSMIAQDWIFTRARSATGASPDVKRQVDECGFCLFKIGGSFAEVAQDIMKLK